MDVTDRKINASRDWLRAMQQTSVAVSQRSRTFSCVLDEQAAVHGDKTAIIESGAVTTFAALSKRANRYARFAIANGIQKGDCVALLASNSADYLAAWSGISATGATVALINTNLRGQALAHSFTAASAKAAFVSRELADAYLTSTAHLDSPLPVWITGLGADSIDADLDAIDGMPLSAGERRGVTLSDCGLYIYTSGTTGLPKAARVSHARIIEWATWFAGLMNTTPDDRMYDCLPMYHSVGGIVAPGSALVSGGSVVIREKFSARQFWDDIVSHDCTLFQYIGDLCRYLAASDPHPLERAHKLRICCGNGLGGDVWETFQNRFAIPRILEFYAATEGSFSLYNVEGKPGAIGRLSGLMAQKPPVALVKHDADTGLPLRGADGLCIRCRDGEIGEALGRLGKAGEGNRFEGYTNGGESDKKIVRDVFARGDRWFRTGDLMSRDAAGYFYFADRIGDTFRWKGENVSTLEVANALSTYPGVINATVYGVVVPGYDGRAGMAAVETTADFDIAGLFDHMAAHLPAYAVPMFIRIVAALATTGTFKPRKQELMAQGFDPAAANDFIFVADAKAGTYKVLTPELYRSLTADTAAA